MASTHKQAALNKTQEDKFWFIMNLPDALKDTNNEYNTYNSSAGISTDAIKFSLISTNIPGINIKSQAIPYAGGNLYVSSHTKSPYDPLKITFRIDNRYTNYLTIYEWINFIYNESEGHFDAEDLADIDGATQKILDLYSTSLSVVSLDEFGQPVVQWMFSKAFPTDLSDISLKYTDSNEIECTATFVFSQMKIRNMFLENIKKN